MGTTGGGDLHKGIIDRNNKDLASILELIGVHVAGNMIG